MITTDIKQFIRRELPVIFREDAEIHQFIIELAREQFADKRETESRFDRMMEQWQRDREEDRRKWDEQNRTWKEHLQAEKQWQEAQNRKWDEQNRQLNEHLQADKQWREEHLQTHKQWEEEQNRKWDEQDRKWEENQKTIQHTLDLLDAFALKYQSDIGAIGARWGFQAEESFRGALQSILERSFGVKVVNINEFDDTGEVFGQPDQVELDIIIKNGLLIICEIKSSMSRSDVYTFSRKIKFYERRHLCTVTRSLIISPMVRDDARSTAAKLGIEVCSYAQEANL